MFPRTKTTAPSHKNRRFNPDKLSFLCHAASFEFRACRKLFNIAQILVLSSSHDPDMDAKQLAKLVQSVPCPTCGAAAGEECELSTGQPRTTPHRDRRLNAADKDKGEAV